MEQTARRKCWNADALQETRNAIAQRRMVFTDTLDASAISAIKQSSHQNNRTMKTPTKSKCGQTPTKAKCDRTPTPRTDKLYTDHMSDPSQDTGDLAAIMHIQCEKLERELIKARRLAEKYRYLSCDSQEEADATLLPWENNQPTEP